MSERLPNENLITEIIRPSELSPKLGLLLNFVVCLTTELNWSVRLS